MLYAIFRDETLRCVSNKHKGMYPPGLAAGGLYFSLMICEKNEQKGSNKEGMQEQKVRKCECGREKKA